MVCEFMPVEPNVVYHRTIKFFGLLFPKINVFDVAQSQSCIEVGSVLVC